MRTDDRCVELFQRWSVTLAAARAERTFELSMADLWSPGVVAELTARIAPGQRYVDVALSARDPDSGVCGGADDVVDLADGSALTTTRFRIDLRAHTVAPLDTVPAVLGGLGVWSSDGRHGPERAAAELSIDIK